MELRARGIRAREARLGHGDGSGRAGRACLGLENGTRNGRVECESCGRRAWKRCPVSPPRTRAGDPGTAQHLAASLNCRSPSWAGTPRPRKEREGHRKTAFHPQTSSSWAFCGGLGVGVWRKRGGQRGRRWSTFLPSPACAIGPDPPRAQSQKICAKSCKAIH